MYYYGTLPSDLRYITHSFRTGRATDLAIQGMPGFGLPCLCLAVGDTTLLYLHTYIDTDCGIIHLLV